jgi:hypothetical protein
MKPSRCGRCEFWQSVRRRFRVTAFTRPRASCWSRLPNTRRDVSPGARRRHSPASSRAAGISNAGRKELRAAGYVAETNGLVTPTAEGLKAAGEVPPSPSTPGGRLALWCDRLPSPAPEMLRALAVRGEKYMDAAELAAVLSKKPSGGHWNSGVAVLRNNGLIETDGRRYRSAALFRK